MRLETRFHRIDSHFARVNGEKFTFTATYRDSKKSFNKFRFSSTFSLASSYSSTISRNCFSAVRRAVFKISSHSLLTNATAFSCSRFFLKANRSAVSNRLNYAANDGCNLFPHAVHTNRKFTSIMYQLCARDDLSRYEHAFHRAISPNRNENRGQATCYFPRWKSSTQLS